MSDWNSSNSVIQEQNKHSENKQDNLKKELDIQQKIAPVKYQPDKKNFSGVLWATVVITTLGMGFVVGQWWQSHSSKTTSQPSAATPSRQQSTPVKAIPIEITSLQETSAFIGTLEAKRSVIVKPEINGRVVEILVQDGSFVSEGQAIAKLKSDEIEANIRRAQANFKQYQARLAQLKTGARPEQIAAARARLNQFQATLAELLAGTRDEEIAEAKAQLEEAEARLADAKSGSLLEEIAQAKAQIKVQEAELELASEQLRRNQELREEGAIAELTFQEFFKEERAANARLEEAKRRVTQLERNQESTIETLTATVEQQRQVLIRLENGTRPEEIQRSQAEVAEARSNLEELENGTRPEEIAQAEAEVAAAIADVESLQAELQNSLVVAPFAGVIGDMIVKIGDFVSEGDTITTLTANQVLDVNLPIPLERRADLRLGLPVEITSPEGKGLGVGQVSFISPTVSADSQTILAKADVDNSAGKLKDNQFVQVDVIWDKRQAVVVPMNAIGFQGEERFVYLLEETTEEQKAKRQTIELGLVKGDVAEVRSGLQPGDKLIVSGVQKLKDGTAVKLLNSENR